MGLFIFIDLNYTLVFFFSAFFRIISKYFDVVPEMGVLDKEISTPKHTFFLVFLGPNR